MCFFSFQTFKYVDKLAYFDHCCQISVEISDVWVCLIVLMTYRHIYYFVTYRHIYKVFCDLQTPFLFCDLQTLLENGKAGATATHFWVIWLYNVDPVEAKQITKTNFKKYF